MVTKEQTDWQKQHHRRRQGWRSALGAGLSEACQVQVYEHQKFCQALLDGFVTLRHSSLSRCCSALLGDRHVKGGALGDLDYGTALCCGTAMNGDSVYRIKILSRGPPVVGETFEIIAAFYAAANDDVSKCVFHI